MAKTPKQATTKKRKTTVAKKTTAGGRRKKSASNKPLEITCEERWRMIAVAAYYKSEKRGFAPGRHVDDWLEAEREVDELLGRR